MRNVAVFSMLVGLMVQAGAAEAAGAAPAGEFAGPPVKGLCILNRDEIFAASKVALSVNSQYRKAFEAAQAEVDSERETLQSEARNLQAKKGALPAEEFVRSESDLNGRLSKLQTKANERSQELESVRRNVLGRIAAEAQPVIQQIYKQRQCGVLVSKEAVLAGSPEMDITAAVVAALDQRISEMPLVAPSQQAAR
jgi:Skp family chaperone for outer membrane proteins